MAPALKTPRNEMYKLEAVYKNDKQIVDLPTCMYGLKNIHGTSENGNKISTMNEDELLIGRQVKILEDLDGISQEVKKIASALGHDLSNDVQATTTHSVIDNPTIVLPDISCGGNDFVMSVSPNSASLSPIFIAEFLKRSGVQVAVTSHVHSSLREPVPDQLQRVTGCGNRTDNPLAQIRFTYVWKQDPFAPSLMHSPLHQTRLYGDASMARYLCRLLVPSLYSKPDEADRWIDNALQMTTGSSKEKDATLKSLNAHLGKREYLCGDKLSIADVVTLSSLLTHQSHFKSLPKNVKRWLCYLLTTWFASIELVLSDSWKS